MTKLHVASRITTAMVTKNARAAEYFFFGRADRPIRRIGVAEDVCESILNA